MLLRKIRRSLGLHKWEYNKPTKNCRRCVYCNLCQYNDPISGEWFNSDRLGGIIYSRERMLALLGALGVTKDWIYKAEKLAKMR